MLVGAPDSSVGIGMQFRLGQLFEQNLSDSQRKIVGILSEPRQLEQIASNTGLAVHVIQADLTMLQIRGVITKEGMNFRKKK